VATVTSEHEHFVDEEVSHEHVEIERVPIGRQVDAIPPVREEGSTTVLPVMEEVSRITTPASMIAVLIAARPS
jgi:hypothetical protein